MKREYVLALDSGTTNTRAILFDKNGVLRGSAQQEFKQLYPLPGWVEHDPLEIWGSQMGVATQVLEKQGILPEKIAAIGITNQRETTILWDKSTGTPVYNAIVWQDKRTAPICEELKKRGFSDYIQNTTGLVIDSYFSATKIKWLLNNVEGLKARARNGEILFGTVDTWLVWKLTRGKAHITDFSNASRTMLFNIKTLEWDETLLEALDIPREILPEVKPSGFLYGETDESLFGGVRIPIAGIAGDQQAALFGQACFDKGFAKNTYGTGSFILMNTGNAPISSNTGLLTTIAWGLDEKVQFALEGSIFITGAAVQWLRDGLKIIHDVSDSEYFAAKEKSSEGVYVVPAFAGLGAPYWDMYARGAILGLTRGSNLNHIIRATLESLAYRVRDVLECMEKDSEITVKELKADGGACVNNFLMQFQADVLGVPVCRPKVIESTARGAAFLAGLAVGLWKDQTELAKTCTLERVFQPEMEQEQREKLYRGWLRAVERAKSWDVDGLQ